MELVTKHSVNTNIYKADTDIYRNHDGSFGPKGPENHSLVARAGNEVTEEMYNLICPPVPIPVQYVLEEAEAEVEVADIMGALEEEKPVAVTVPPGKASNKKDK